MTVNRLKHRADARRARSCNHITRWEERRPASALRALLSSTHNGRCFCSVLTAAIVTSLFASCARGTAETTGNYSRISSVESNTEPWRPFSLSCWKRRVKTLLRSSLFLVGFQPSGVTCRTYVCTSKVLPRRMVTSGMVDRGRGGGLVLGFLSLSLSFFFILFSVCSVGWRGWSHGGPEWNRFFWRARAIHEQWKEPPEKRNVYRRNRLFRDSCGHSKGTWNGPRKRACYAPPSRGPLRTRVDVYSSIELVTTRMPRIFLATCTFVGNVIGNVDARI